MSDNTNKTNFWSFEEDIIKVFIITLGLLSMLILCGITISAVHHGYLVSMGLQQCQAVGTTDILWQRECVSIVNGVTK